MCSDLLLECIIFSNLTLVEVNYDINNNHVERGVLEEVSLKSWINPVSKT